MIRTLILLTWCCGTISLCAQVRVNKLVINPKEVFHLAPSDILVADTLVMLDSSCVMLNTLRTENYIRTNVIIVKGRSFIDGRGMDGKAGLKGADGTTFIGPCQAGRNGAAGRTGLDGASGIKLFLYIDSLAIEGSLVINLSGGNGGDGGDGGAGGGGSPGTNQCQGGNGGHGANGGNGGNGGLGGTLTLGGKHLPEIRSMLRERVILYNKGGTFGYGGISGYGGPAGLGPGRRNGKGGERGTDGRHGRPGGNGTLVFEN